MENRVNRVEKRLDEVEAWQERIEQELESAKRQRRKLFATFDEHSKASKLSSERMHRKLDNQAEKLDAIIKRLDLVDEKDIEQDCHIQKQEKKIKEAEEARKLLTEQFKKNLPAATGILGFLSLMVSLILSHLPEIGEAAITVWKNIRS